MSIYSIMYECMNTYVCKRKCICMCINIFMCVCEEKYKTKMITSENIVLYTLSVRIRKNKELKWQEWL